MDLKEIGWESVDWIQLTHYMGQWLAFGFYKRQGVSWLAEQLLVSQEGLCTMKLLSWKDVLQKILNWVSQDCVKIVRR